MRLSRLACRGARAEMPGPARAWSMLLRSCLAATTVFSSGCLATQRRAAVTGPSVPPQVPETAVGAEVAETTQVLTRRNTEFHETATDRQRFQVHIDFGRVFESQGNYDAALLEYQEALSVVEGKRRGPFRPADSAMAHRRMGAAL